jgi:hypothetical protein
MAKRRDTDGKGRKLRMRGISVARCRKVKDGLIVGRPSRSQGDESTTE